MIKISAILLAFLLFVSCGTTPSNPVIVEEPAEEPLPITLSVAVDELPSENDPITSGFGQVSPVFTSCYEGLFSYDSVTGVLTPAICSDYSVSEDGLVYTFDLRTNAKYSNADPITADDFVETFYRILDGEGDPLVAEQLTELILGAEDYVLPASERPEEFDISDVGIYANGNYELELILTKPSYDLIPMLAMPAFAPTYRGNNFPDEKSAEDTDAEQFSPIHVASGPFAIASQKDGEFIAIKNTSYYNMLEVTVEQVVFSTDFLDETLGFANNEINIILDPEESLSTTFSGRLVETPSFDTVYLSFNTQRSPTNNLLVREAISLAIDRTMLVDILPAPAGMPATGLVPPGYVYGEQDFSDVLTRSSFNLSDDIEQSQQSLVDARFRDGVGLNLSMIVMDDDPYLAYYYEMVDMIRQTTRGELDLIELSEREFNEALGNGGYNIAAMTSTGDVVHPGTHLSTFHSDHPENYTGYDDNIYDGLINEATINPSGMQNKEILQEAEIHLMANFPIAPLFHPVQRVLINDNTDGCYLNPLGNLYITNAYVAQEDGAYQVDGF